MNEYLVWLLYGLYCVFWIVLFQIFFSAADKHPDDRKPTSRFMRPFEVVFRALTESIRKLDPTTWRRPKRVLKS